MPLKRNSDRRGRPIAMLRDNEVSLTCPRRLTLVGILAVEQDDDIGILLE